ncbi:hypothetical protein HN604_00775 [archaeon]|jgi:hypothetical protein|nr:hypothetical protein [archaeon]MBT6182394.1 hypothetical protein [archaeon]MBT6606822.1 hypothetical protein [archaeon]MBT7251705.1 hypothetical protein [archaeon]MBT7660598.1 hypothetical protein [archaeon]
MNKFTKRILLGLVIWAVPFITSFFFWDVQANAPSVSQEWFSAIMTLTLMIGFGIAAYFYFKSVKKGNAILEGWITGIIWYVELVLLDLIFLVGIFDNSIASLFPVFFIYLSVPALSIVLENIVKRA